MFTAYSYEILFDLKFKQNHYFESHIQTFTIRFLLQAQIDVLHITVRVKYFKRFYNHAALKMLYKK